MSSNTHDCDMVSMAENDIKINIERTPMHQLIATHAKLNGVTPDLYPHIRDHADKFDKNVWYIFTKSIKSIDMIREFEDYVNWKHISRTFALTDEEIIEFADRLDWQIVSRIRKLTPLIYDKLAYYINWGVASRHQTMSEEFILEYGMYLDWKIAAAHQRFTSAIYEKFKSRINWTAVIRGQTDFPSDFFRKYADLIDWRAVSNRVHVFHNIIIRHSDRVDWKVASQSGKFTEEELSMIADKLDWVYIATHYTLSESIINQNIRSKEEWKAVCRYQSMSVKFMNKNVSNLRASNIDMRLHECPFGQIRLDCRLHVSAIDDCLHDREC